MQLNSMPNECLGLIFTRIPITRRFSLRLVCHRWKQIVESTFLPQTNLKIFSSEDVYDLYIKDLRKYNLARDTEFALEKNDGSLENAIVLNADKCVIPDVCSFLGVIFPHISRLVYYVEPAESVLYLIDFWGHQLTSLTFFGPFYNFDLHEHFWNKLNSLCHLTHLHMFDLFTLKVPNEMPIYGKLKHLSIVRYEHRVEESFSQLGSSFNSLMLGSCRLTTAALRAIKEVNPALMSNLKSLKLHQIFMNLSYEVPVFNCNKLFEYIGNNFLNLEFLDITYFRVSLGPLVPRLIRLQLFNLKTLYIHLDRFNQLHKLDKYYELRLPSVETLHFSDDHTVDCSWTEVEDFYPILPWIFPEVKRLYLYSYQPLRLQYLQTVIPEKVQYRVRIYRTKKERASVPFRVRMLASARRRADCWPPLQRPVAL